MSNFGDALSALADRLEAGVPGLKAYDYLPDSVNSYPAAVIIPQEMDYEIVLAGNTFTTNVDVWLLLGSGDDAAGFSALWNHLDPTAANQSIRAAVLADKTLAGTVDYAQVRGARDIGRAQEFGGWYFGARFVVEICKTVS